MAIGRPLDEVLSETQAAVFFQALDDLMEDFFQDVADAANGTPFVALSMADYLPAGNLSAYDSLFARQFLASLLVVGWKLRSPGSHRLACIAEHLALRAVGRRAIEYAETTQDAERIGRVHADLFSSIGLQHVFERPSSGPPWAVGESAGAGVNGWFEAFGPDNPVYPHVDTQGR
jgi:hypothetical protein